jgi:phosphoglycolate phosphatase
MMAIKAILFDKDGTLIDVNRTWVPLYRRMLAIEFALGPEEVTQKMIEAGYDPETDSFRSGSILAGGTTDQLVRIWWADESPEQQTQIARRLDREYAPLARENLLPLLDLSPLLDQLTSMGMTLGVGTNDSLISAVGQIEHLNIKDKFVAIIGQDSVARPKPSGDMIRHFANLAGCRPEEIAMVGDNTHDMEEAKLGGAGLAIGVLTGNARAGDLDHLADHVVSDISLLPDLLNRQIIVE